MGLVDPDLYLGISTWTSMTFQSSGSGVRKAGVKLRNGLLKGLEGRDNPPAKVLPFGTISGFRQKCLIGLFRWIVFLIASVTMRPSWHGLLFPLLWLGILFGHSLRFFPGKMWTLLC